MKVELEFNDTTAGCRANHFGHWYIEPKWLQSAVAAVKDGTFEMAGPKNMDEDGQPLYEVEPVHGIAAISLIGQMQKGASKFGGTSTIRTRRALRAASADKKVNGIMMLVDSPGGTVAGTAELAADIGTASQIKPLHVHIEDLGASAALWASTQGQRVTANATALIGSIGTVSVVYDESARYAREGVKVHVVSTGDHKGSFVPGSEVSDEQLDDLQSIIDQLNEHFLSGVANGRNIPLSAVREMADGRVHMAAQAHKMGLIDAVESSDQAVMSLISSIKQLKTATKRSARATAAARLRLQSFRDAL